MSAKELIEWQAYEMLEPFGEWRADLRMGIICQTMASLWADTKGKKITPQNFMPEFDRPPKKFKHQSPDEIKAVFRQIAGAVGTIN